MNSSLSIGILGLARQNTYQKHNFEDQWLTTCIDVVYRKLDVRLRRTLSE
jgi:hypothetical protein